MSNDGNTLSTSPPSPSPPPPQLQPQLGLTKDELYRIYGTMNDMRLFDLKQLHWSIQPQSTNPPPTIHEINRRHKKLLDLHKGAYDQYATLTPDFYRLSIDIMTWSYYNLINVTLGMLPVLLDDTQLPHHQTTLRSDSEFPELLRQSISMAYDIVDFHSGYYSLLPSEDEITQAHPRIQAVLLDVRDRALPPFLRWIHPSLRIKAKYYELKLYQFLAATQLRCGDTYTNALQTSYTAVEIWRELHQHGYYGMEYISADPLKEGSRLIEEYGANLCYRVRGRELEGVDMLSEAVGYMEITLKGTLV
jgi:hypothetical protein